MDTPLVCLTPGRLPRLHCRPIDNIPLSSLSLSPMLSLPCFSCSNRCFRATHTLFSLGDWCPVLIPLPSKAVNKFLTRLRSAMEKQPRWVLDLLLKGGQIMRRVDGKTVGGPGEYFVGCADLIETYHYPLAFSRPLPQVPVSPFPFPIYHSTVRASPRYEILPLRW